MTGLLPGAVLLVAASLTLYGCDDTVIPPARREANRSICTQARIIRDRVDELLLVGGSPADFPATEEDFVSLMEDIEADTRRLADSAVDEGAGDDFVDLTAELASHPIVEPAPDGGGSPFLAAFGELFNNCAHA